MYGTTAVHAVVLNCAKQTDTSGSANMGIFAKNLRKTLNRKIALKVHTFLKIAT